MNIFFNNSYKKLNVNPSIIKKQILAFDEKFKLSRNDFKFPYLFITVKFHENPVKFRFVTCGTNSYNYKASKIWFNALNSILKVLESSNNCYIINNNCKVLDFYRINKENIESVNTFDFENLFGSIPQNFILDVFGSIYEEFSSV